MLYVGATEKITGTGNVDTINSQRNDGTVSLMLFFDLLGGEVALVHVYSTKVKKTAKVENLFSETLRGFGFLFCFFCLFPQKKKKEVTFLLEVAHKNLWLLINKNA